MQIKIIFFPCLFTLFSFLFTFPIHADLQMSATVPPHSTDFQFAFVATDGQTNVSQNQTLTYQITYGAKQSAGQTTTIQLTADYSSDAIAGVNILDYVSESATNGYGNAHPIIDLVNRKIHWTVIVPQGVTDQTVSFALRTNTDYTGNATVPLTVSASGQNEYVNLGQFSDTKNYHYTQTQVPPTPTPTNKPLVLNPKLSPIPTLLPIPQKLQITDINITGITQDSIMVTTTTNQPAPESLHYGTSPNLLNTTVSANALTTQQTFILTSLSPSSTYYLQVAALGATSDILVVQTASTTPRQTIQNQTVSLTSNGILLSNTNTDNTHAQTVTAVFTPEKNFEVNFSLAQAIAVKSLTGIIKRASVLGINTFSALIRTRHSFR